MSGGYIALCIAFACGWFCRWLWEKVTRKEGSDAVDQ